MKIYDPKHALPGGCAVVIVAVGAVALIVTAILAQHTGIAHANAIQSWAATRHAMCVNAERYFHRHAIGSTTCIWNHVPGTHRWVMSLFATLGRPPM